MLFERIKKLRIESKETQQKIANTLNVNQSAYSRWESGKETIPLEKLLLLTVYYNISFDYIIGLSKNKGIAFNVFLNKNIIGQKIKAIRKSYNITQIQLANLLKTTQSTISAFENGKVLILTVFIWKIAKKFDISIDELVK